MRFPQPLISGTLIKRYKRFLADIQLDSGELITAHTANTGSMKGLLQVGNRVYLSHHDNPKRKLKYTWEIVKVGRTLVGINTHLPNSLVEEGIQNGVIAELQGYEELKREVKYGKNSRIDILLNSTSNSGLSPLPLGEGARRAGEGPVDSAPKGHQHCYIEIKNVTLVENNTAYFPDAITERGQKHLIELMSMVDEGHRAVIFFVLQRADGKEVAPADHIDVKYGKLLRQALDYGVEALAYRAKVSSKGILLRERVGVKI